jgi:hypothetical protein
VRHQHSQVGLPLAGRLSADAADQGQRRRSSTVNRNSRRTSASAKAPPTRCASPASRSPTSKGE